MKETGFCTGNIAGAINTAAANNNGGPSSTLNASSPLADKWGTCYLYLASIVEGIYGIASMFLYTLEGCNRGDDLD